jgi:hypothetical protein
LRFATDRSVSVGVVDARFRNFGGVGRDAPVQRIALVRNPHVVGAARTPSRALASRALRSTGRPSRDERVRGKAQARRLPGTGVVPLVPRDSGSERNPRCCLLTGPSSTRQLAPDRLEVGACKHPTVLSRLGHRLVRLPGRSSPRIERAQGEPKPLRLTDGISWPLRCAWLPWCSADRSWRPHSPRWCENYAYTVCATVGGLRAGDRAPATPRALVDGWCDGPRRSTAASAGGMAAG